MNLICTNSTGEHQYFCSRAQGIRNGISPDSAKQAYPNLWGITCFTRKIWENAVATFISWSQMAFLCKSHYNLQQLNTSTAKLWRHGAGVEAPSNRRFPMVTRGCRCLPTLQGTDGSSTTSGKICKAPFVWWSGWTTGTAIWHERTSRCLGCGCFFCWCSLLYYIYIYISFGPRCFVGGSHRQLKKKCQSPADSKGDELSFWDPKMIVFMRRYVQFQM